MTIAIQQPNTTAHYQGLVNSLELPAKVTMLTGATTFTLAPQDSIGLGEVRLSDGPTGVRGLKFSGGREVTLFPNATLLASAWSEDTAYEVGRLLAEEAMAQQIHVVLGPTINLHRSPLGGRLFEAYSEDPLLTGKIAAAYVRGLQDSGVGACLKHLIANESETDRNTMSSVVDETTLRELYLLPFEVAVEEADAWSIMAAYNDVNGVAATEQAHVNNEIVKGEWGYQGLIMSDWFATRTAAPAANGGLDLVMPGPAGPWGDALVTAVQSGEVDEAVIDDHLVRLLRLADRVGALGKHRDYPQDLPAPDSATRREQLTRLAADGITVLTNDNQTLPLNRTQSVALIGRPAVETINMGGGSAQVNPPYQVSVAEGLHSLLGALVSVIDGVEIRTRPVPARDGFLTDPETGDGGVHFTVFAADGSVIEERHSAAATTVVGFDDDFDTPVAKVGFRARVNYRGMIEFGTLGAGAWDLAIAGEQFKYQAEVSGSGFGEEVLAPPIEIHRIDLRGDGILEGAVTLRSPATINAIGADGQTDPTGSIDNFAGKGLFGLIAHAAPRDPADVIADAVTAARASDIAVVMVGLTEEQETESVDKTTLALPGAQDDLVRAVAAAANRTVVVVNAATPVIMPWLDQVDAVLWAGLPGQEGGRAIAAVLLGDLEPAGRLVTTFPTDDNRSPAWSVTPVGGNLEYTEGTFIGYRGHYAQHAPEPAFWLGHGLGYATWDYRDASITAANGAVGVAVTVTNTGTRPSREIVQVYFKPIESEQPVRLVGWQPISLQPGAAETVNVGTDPRLWRRWDTSTNTWDQLSAGGTLLIARGLGDIRASLDLGQLRPVLLR